MSVESRLATLGAYLAAEDPFGRLSGKVFVDAQAAIQWVRLGIFEKVLRLLPKIDNQPRFQMQDAAFNEAVTVLARKFGAGSRDEVGDHLRGCSNLYVDEPIPASSSLGAAVTDVQERVFLEAGEDPDDWPPSRHLGEAETLAVMRLFAPDAVFVTADKDAIAVAKSAGIGHPVRPFAFAAGVVRSMEDVTEFWGFACYGRACISPGAWHEACVEALECTDFHDAVIDRSPINPGILKAENALRWMHEDVRELVAAVE
ncbi:MAG: hypothetical protein IH941_00845 [Acidobacteria bacterium]|nr:hypothetical protein [Acidobacteriota bacterium]